jgi:hypothetical protein
MYRMREGVWSLVGRYPHGYDLLELLLLMDIHLPISLVEGQSSIIL